MPTRSSRHHECPARRAPDIPRPRRNCSSRPWRSSTGICETAAPRSRPLRNAPCGDHGGACGEHTEPRNLEPGVLRNALRSVTRRCRRSAPTRATFDLRQLLRNGWREAGAEIFGIHVHVGVRSGEKAIAMVNALSAYIPHFLALSASSPYWMGHDTGMASWRSKVFESLPTVLTSVASRAAGRSSSS